MVRRGLLDKAAFEHRLEEGESELCRQLRTF